MNSGKPSSNKIALGIAAGIGTMVLIGAIGGGLGLHETGGIVTLLYGLAFAAIPTWVGFKVSGWKPVPTATKKKNAPNTEAGEKATIAKNEYILVPASMVMHRSSCRYAQNLYTGNYSRTNSRSAALSVGYRPCKYCKP